MDIRIEQLTTWLKSILGGQHFEISVASADASFRRYFRLTLADKSLIAMDAPPNKENSEPFVRIAKMLNRAGVHTPKIHNADLTQGFVLLEDLGSSDYIDSLSSKESADPLYQDALLALIKIQGSVSDPTVTQPPAYSAAKLNEEMNLFQDWYLLRHLSKPLSESQLKTWQNTKDFLSASCLEQPQVWVHRDFHCRNLMLTETNNPGVIDFQDLVSGPISYDLASLFKDCYIEWSREDQIAWLSDYYQLLGEPTFEFSQLVKWYDLTGLQRHLKVLGIFCRLNYRDGKSRYLADLPLVAKYCLEVLELYGEEHEVLASFKHDFSAAISRAL